MGISAASCLCSYFAGAFVTHFYQHATAALSDPGFSHQYGRWIHVKLTLLSSSALHLAGRSVNNLRIIVGFLRAPPVSSLHIAGRSRINEIFLCIA